MRDGNTLYVNSMELTSNAFYRRVREYEIRNGIVEQTAA